MNPTDVIKVEDINSIPHVRIKLKELIGDIEEHSSQSQQIMEGLSDRVKTLEQQLSATYASVTATAQTTAVTDVLPAIGEINKVYRVGNWDGSQFDASAYSEYAWNGSQYVHLSTKTQIGEVFDISAYHATGGELAKYADLAAALDSNNGGGVPQSLQEGGMSVKFVQSSDNKYVQFRYMLQYKNTTAGNRNFTNTANWQGIDVSPSRNSINLVESGGVNQSIVEIRGLLLASSDFEQGTIDSHGEDEESSTRIRTKDKIYLKKDSTITFAPSSAQMISMVLYIGDSSEQIGRWIKEKEKYTVEQDCYIRFLVRNDNGIIPSDFDSTIQIEGLITNCERKINDIEKVLFNSPTNIDYTDFEQGNYNSSGNKGSSTTRIRTSNRFAVTKGAIIVLTVGYDRMINVGKYINNAYSVGSWINISSTLVIDEDCDVVFQVRKTVSSDTITPSECDCSVAVYGYSNMIIDLYNGKKKGTSNYPTKLKYTNKFLSFAHRGDAAEAPENTIPAFVMAYKNEFDGIETDIKFTSDGVCVLCHDDTIDRTSDGTGTISSMTYQQLLQYDFGSWKGEQWTGTKIPTYEEMLLCCRTLGLKVYLEIKTSISQAQADNLVKLAKQYRMFDNITFFCNGSSYSRLTVFRDADPRSRIGYSLMEGVTSISDSVLQDILGLRTGYNEVVVTKYPYTEITDSIINTLKANNLPLSYSVLPADGDINLPAYVNEAITNGVKYNDVLKNSYLSIVE